MQYKTTILWGLMLGLPMYAQAAEPAVSAVNNSSSFEIRQVQPNILERRQDANINVQMNMVSPVPAGADQVRFILNSLQLEGNRVLSTAQLASAWQPMLGQQVTLADIYQLANQLTERYQREGYILSQVIVPQQTVQNGQIRLQVIEGRIGQVELTGELAQHGLLQQYAEKIKSEQPTTQRTLERFLLLYNDLGGVESQSFVKATDQVGVLNLVVQAQKKPIQLSVGVHNRVSESVGKIRMESYAIVGNLFGLFEQHYMGFNSSFDQKSNSVVYQGSVPIGTNGLQASASLSGAWVKPELNGIRLSESQSTSASLGLNYPAIRTRNTNVYSYGSLDFNNNQRDSAFNGQRDNDEKIRNITLGVRAEHLDTWHGVNQLDISTQKGLNVLGASEQGDALLSGVAGVGNPQFFKQNLYLARLQSLGYGFSVLSAVTGQWSKDNLLSSQQFVIGGNSFLRAYDPGEIAGDRGIAAKLELRHQSHILNTDLTSYGFYDWGEARYNAVEGKTKADSEQAQSAGLGLRFSTRFGINGYVEAVKPIERKTAYDQSTDPRVFAGLSFEY